MACKSALYHIANWLLTVFLRDKNIKWSVLYHGFDVCFFIKKMFPLNQPPHRNR